MAHIVCRYMKEVCNWPFRNNDMPVDETTGFKCWSKNSVLEDGSKCPLYTEDRRRYPHLRCENYEVKECCFETNSTNYDYDELSLSINEWSVDSEDITYLKIGRKVYINEEVEN